MLSGQQTSKADKSFFMGKNLTIKTVAIFAIILVCIYGIIGLPKSKAELLSNWNQNIKLGLDLRGGSHLVLQVQVQDAFKAEADRVIESLKEQLKKANVDYASIDRNDPQRIEDAETVQITVKGVSNNGMTAFREAISANFPEWTLNSIGANDYKLNIKPTAALVLRRDTIDRTKNTIENRVNGMGLSEATVQQQGRRDAESEIIVQMPGVDDPGRVKDIIKTAAVLEISAVKDGPFPSMDQALSKMGGVMPLGTKLVKQAVRPGDQGETWWLVNRSAVVNGRDLRNARPSRDDTGKWETSFQLSQDGGRRFGEYTGANIGNKLAVVLDNQTRSVATINGKIEDSGRIMGQFSEPEASDLALVLRSGSLPAGITFLQEETVGPSLGADSIQYGILAGVIGVTAVVFFMLVYYKKAGINAVLALVLNAVILIACLSYFGAVLTLPGIAGIILTIGMAVDSNVLIFERIREELRAGKGVIAAVDAGFSKAFLTIIDTHVTTIVSCAFLFVFGTTAVKGFAISLVIGLIANVFTAVFVSKVIFDYELSGNKQVESLSI